MARHARWRRPLAAGIVVVLIAGLLRVRLLPPAVLVLSLPFLVLFFRKPVLRRLALGHITRRPRETLLVVLGSLLGTAIITGSFVVGDTLEASIARTVYDKLGPIDELVSLPADAVPEAERALHTLPSSEVDGVLPITSLVATVSGTGPNPAAEPTAQVVEVDFDRARRFGGDAHATGISGRTPRAGEAAVGRDLADTLRVGAGDRVRLYAYGETRELVVTGVLPRRGIAGFDRRGVGGSASATLFVRPGLSAELAASGRAGGAPPTTFIAVSNAGGVRRGAERTATVEPLIRDALEGQPVSINTVKRDVLDAAKAVGESFTQLFTMIGLFSVLAGILLLVNIFVMLAEERKPELGMLRAVGLTRANLVGSFSLEGWMYALGSAALGTVAGLGVGRLIVAVAASVFGSSDLEGGDGLDLLYTATRASAMSGFQVGFVMGLATIVVTSLRISRLNVIRAIRDLPEPVIERRRVATFVLGAIALVAGMQVVVSSIRREMPVPLFLGSVLAAAGAIPLLSRLLPRRFVISLVSSLLLAWAIFAFSLFPEVFRRAEIIVFVVQGVILVGSAVAVLSHNQQLVGAALRRVGGGAKSMALRLGLAYPLANRFRTGMTLAMYALVVYMLTVVTVFSHLFGGQVDAFTEQVSGGFDLVASSNPSNPIPTEELEGRSDVTSLAPLAEVFGEWDGDFVVDGPISWPAAAIDERFIAHRAPTLARRPAHYRTDEEAYRAVLADPNLFIPTGFFLQRGGGGPPRQVQVGEQLTLRDPISGRSRVLTVAAVAESGFGNLRPVMSYQTLRSIFGERVVPNVFYVSTAAGVDAQAVADRINGAFLANGANANSFERIITTNLTDQLRFFRLMRGYLALGLAVGIAGLGVVMVRAVRERRREVGVLRSLGFEAGAVRRAFVAESAFVAVEGVFVGTALAIVTVWRLVSNADFGADLRFAIPWTSLGILVAGTIVASLVATATPAHQASRIRPAVALRIAD